MSKTCYTFIVVLTTLFFACKDKKTTQMQEHIKKSYEMMLYRIESVPVEPNSQQEGVIYICDHPIIEKIDISDREKEFKKVLSDTSNYIYDMQKRCMPMYRYGAILISKKDTLDLVVADNPCTKAIFYLHSKNEKTYVDLTPENSVLDFLKAEK